MVAVLLVCVVGGQGRLLSVGVVSRGVEDVPLVGVCLFRRVNGYCLCQLCIQWLF